MVKDCVEIVVSGCHLQQDGGDCVVRHDDNGVSRVKVCEDGSSGEHILQCFKGCLAFWTPDKGGVFPHESVHWHDNVQIVCYEPPVEVSKP